MSRLNPTPTCGNGLHGLLWGDGNWELLNSSLDAVWQVVEVDAESIVAIDKQKVKFPLLRRALGGMAEAVTMVLNHAARSKEMLATAKEIASGNYSTAASRQHGIPLPRLHPYDYSTAASSTFTIRCILPTRRILLTGRCILPLLFHGCIPSFHGCIPHYSRLHPYDYSTAASSLFQGCILHDSSTAASSGKNTIAMAAGLGCAVSAGEWLCFRLLRREGEAQQDSRRLRRLERH